MREVKNNVEIGKIQKMDVKAPKTENAEPQFCAEVQDASIKDFSNPKAETLGRSQVLELDNLKSDVKFAATNPETVEASDKLFDLALAKLQAEGNPNAYEIASSIATSPEAKELLSK